MRTFKATEFTAVDPKDEMYIGELEALAWMAEGKDNATIGILRGHGEPGAKKLVARVLIRFHAHTRCLAVSRAFATGYLKCHHVVDLTKEHSREMLAIALIAVGGWLSISSDYQDMYRRAPRQVARIVRGGQRTRVEGFLIDWANAA